MFSLLASLFFLFATAAPGWSEVDNTGVKPATIADHYSGGFKDDYPQELVRVRSYLLAVQSDIATQLGLQYGQGFRHPVTIRFDDGAPGVNENPFFYVQSKGTGNDFSQDMVANVEAYARRRKEWSDKENDLRGGFRYALTEIMLNDSAAGDPDKILPLWVQEGLSVYTSGTGEALVKAAAEKTVQSKARDLVGELNSPGPYLTPREWALYYLAIKYIAVNGGLQTFIRNMTNGRSAADSVRDTLSEEWPAFETAVRNYALESFKKFALADDDLQTQTGTRAPAR